LQPRRLVRSDEAIYNVGGQPFAVRSSKPTAATD
jgi:hypothetical protein